MIATCPRCGTEFDPGYAKGASRVVCATCRANPPSCVRCGAPAKFTGLRTGLPPMCGPCYERRGPRSCSMCGRLLPAERFYSHQSRCKDCFRIWHRTRTGQQAKQSEEHRAARRDLWEDRNGRPLTQAIVIRMLRADARRRGRTPTSRDWEKTAKHRTTTDTVRRLFGTWLNALTAAGLEPGRSGPRRGSRWSRRRRRAQRRLASGGDQ